MKIDKDIEKIFEEVIKKMYNEAWSTFNTVKYLKEKYKLENSRAYEIIREAKLYFAKFVNEAKSDPLNECLNILEITREKALAANDLKEVRECTKEIAKLQQLYIEKIDVTSKGEKINIIINKS